MRHVAGSWGFIDIPNERSAHLKQIPRGAGIGFFLAVAVVLPLFYAELLLSYIWTIIAITFVFIVGVLDDHRDISPKVKFIVLTLATLILAFDDILIRDLGIFFGFHISLGWVALPFTIFAVVSFTNALNLIDGLDGLAGIVSLVILTTFFFVGYKHEDFFIMLISASFVASLLAFLIFNWSPASIFMGDSGSLTLGFIISILAIRSLVYIPAVSILFITAIPIFDTVIVVTRRIRDGKAVFLGDHYHMHHILRGFFAKNTRKTVFVLGSMQVTYSIIGVSLDKNIDEGSFLILFVLNTVILYLFLNAMIRREKKEC